MVATLPHPTVVTWLLTTMADLITAGGAKAAVCRASPLATGPTETATGITILLPTDRAGRYATGGAKNFLTTATLV